KKKTLEIVTDQNNGKLPGVLGVSSNNTQAIIEELNVLNYDEIDGILSASPHYNKPSQKGIIAHYKAIADTAKRPVILYNVPGRTGSNILPETVVELAKHKNIVAVKEASGDVMQVMEILKSVPTDFAVLSGEDALAMPFAAMGGNGVISVVANA